MLDYILSSVEQYTGKKDKFNNAFTLLIKSLEENNPLKDKQKSAVDIAGMQNFDGSFFHCEVLKNKYSLMALMLFLKEVDVNIYRKQIQSLISFLSNTELSGRDAKEFANCREMARKIGVSF